MLFFSKLDNQIVDLEIKSAADGGFDVIQREIVFEKHYKNRQDIYEDFEDV